MDVPNREDLEGLAADLGIDLRYDALEGRGGLCKYGGKTCLILNRSLSVQERIHLLSRALSRFPLDDVFLIPAIREAIDPHQDEESMEPDENAVPSMQSSSLDGDVN